MRLYALLVLVVACGSEFQKAESAAGGAGGSAGSAEAGRGGELVGGAAGASGGLPGAGKGGTVATAGSGTAGAMVGAGAGGELVPQGHPECAAAPVPPASGWVITADPVTDSHYPPELAIDGSEDTRFSTGEPQQGDEWLQVDFGEAVALTSVSLACCKVVAGFPESLEDYARGWAVRLSDQPLDLGAPVLAAGEGAPGGIVATFAPAVGRYLLVTQTGSAVESWWSVHELGASCE